MDNSKLTNAYRTSSKITSSEKEFTLKASRQDLKRRISAISDVESPLEHTRLRIEETELEVANERLQKSYPDIEKDQNGLTDDQHRSAHREINKRIISLGSDLWQMNRSVRELEEQLGTAIELGLDSKGPFVHTLLSLYTDPFVPAARSKSEQALVRKATIERYDAAKEASMKGKLWCAITGAWYDEELMIAVHIVPSKLGARATDYIFGEGSRTRLHTADNSILMHLSVEHAFDKGFFVLMPADSSESPIRRWKIVLTSRDGIHHDMGRLRLRDFIDKEVQWRNEARPAARFLYFHFVITLLRCKRERTNGWEQNLVEFPTGKPLAMMGPYLRQSMLLVLAKHASDLSDEEETNLLAQTKDEVFTSGDNLSAREEAEIARRVFEVKDQKAEEEGWMEDEEED